MANLPPLKFTHKDVETAISRQFRIDFSKLSFAKGKTFCAIEPGSNCNFFLQKPLDGEGEYSFRGQANLQDSATIMTYNVEGRVSVANNQGTPQIKFNGIISCNHI